MTRRETRDSGRSRAFTLIELLVVIAIIGILASLLLVAVSHGQDEARKVKCKNNLHEFYLAIQIYQNYEEQIPGWLSNLYPAYVQAPQMYICPADSKSRGKEGGKPPWQTGPGSEQYVETDDFDGSQASSVDPVAAALQNHDIKGNSYLYEFCCAKCSWWNGTYVWKGISHDTARVDRDGDGVVTWYEVKMFEVGVVGPHTPYVRCFWHTAGFFGRYSQVLNQAYGGQIYTSRLGADDWKDDGM